MKGGKWRTPEQKRGLLAESVSLEVFVEGAEIIDSTAKHPLVILWSSISLFY